MAHERSGSPQPRHNADKMFKPDATQAVPIVNATVEALLRWLPTQGRQGSDARSACGAVQANALTYLHDDTIGPPLAKCFDFAREAGMTFLQMDDVRAVAAAQSASLVGAIVVRDACIELALVEMARIIANMVFVSRLDVDRIREAINAAYAPVEEEVADQMDSISYRALIGLHAAVIAHLTERARPLPQLLYFRFSNSLPSLVIAHKLYADAGRADEVRRENKVIHPLFELSTGRALSA